MIKTANMEEKLSEGRTEGLPAVIAALFRGVPVE